MPDEIIDEVRIIKETLAEECGFDIRLIFEAIKRSEDQTALEGWEHIQPMPPAPHSVHRSPRLPRR